MRRSEWRRRLTFPQLSLSGALGGQSTQLTSLFSGPASTWSLVPQVSQPIFTAGKLKSGVKLAQAQRDSALMQYEKTIQTAFSEVSDSLIAHQRVRESREEQETAGHRATGPGASGVPSLSRRRRHATERAGRRSRSVPGGTDFGPNPAGGAVDRGSTIQSAGRWLAINVPRRAEGRPFLARRKFRWLRRVGASGYDLTTLQDDRIEHGLRCARHRGRVSREDPGRGALGVPSRRYALTARMIGAIYWHSRELHVPLCLKRFEAALWLRSVVPAN